MLIKLAPPSSCQDPPGDCAKFWKLIRDHRIFPYGKSFCAITTVQNKGTVHSTKTPGDIIGWIKNIVLTRASTRRGKGLVRILAGASGFS